MDFFLSHLQFFWMEKKYFSGFWFKCIFSVFQQIENMQMNIRRFFIHVYVTNWMRVFIFVMVLLLMCDGVKRIDERRLLVARRKCRRWRNESKRQHNCQYYESEALKGTNDRKEEKQTSAMSAHKTIKFAWNALQL